MSAVGVVPLEGRGDLPFVTLHGEPLLLHAVRAVLGAGLGAVVVTGEADQRTRARELLAAAAGVEVVAPSHWWADVSGHQSVLLADPLCPLVPSSFLAEVLAAATGEEAVAGYRPVTDTVKTVVDDHVEGTLDRATLAVVTSPVVMPGAAVSAEPPPVRDVGRLAAWLRGRTGLMLVEAPPLARRVGDEAAVRVLECLEELDATTGT